MSVIVRAMTANDLAAVEQIQSDAYADHFLESADVIAQRFALSPATAWVAERKGQACAYLIGYWSMLGKINPFNAPFTLTEEANCLYLHDLALLKSAQGGGVAKKLIHAATELAVKNTAQAMALLSVQNSKPFWQGFGFTEFLDLEMVQKNNLKTYVNDNEAACYMVKYF